MYIHLSFKLYVKLNIIVFGAKRLIPQYLIPIIRHGQNENFDYDPQPVTSMKPQSHHR